MTDERRLALFPAGTTVRDPHHRESPTRCEQVEYRKIGSIRTLFKELHRDYYKPIRTDGGFAGRNNNYIEYTSKGDRYENLSPKEYLNVTRPYLSDLINEHRPTVELNNNNNNNSNNNNSNNNNNCNNNNNSNNNSNSNSNSNNSNRAERKIQLTMQNSCISTKSFEETRTIYTKSEPVKIFMGSNTKYVINKLFSTLLQKFQNAQETSNERGSEFIPGSVELLYYHFQRIDIRRAESYINSRNWIGSKKATTNPKNEKDNECFKWPILSGLNYNKINEKYLKKIEQLKRVDIDLSSHQRDWEKFEQENNSIALNVLFVSYNSEEIKLAHKSNYNKGKNQVILLIINDNEANNCYYFAVKNLSEINSLGWLKGKEEAIINNDNSFKSALDDALN